jgi:hypothetical protein
MIFSMQVSPFYPRLDVVDYQIEAMETERGANYTFMGQNFSDLSMNDDSLAFSDCNSDKFGEFKTASSESQQLLISCVADSLDELIRQLVSDLEFYSIEEQKQAAMEIRLLAKKSQKIGLKLPKPVR